MTERPILFSGPMVRAILEGRKTQTRRAVKPWPTKSLRVGNMVLPAPTLADYEVVLRWVRETDVACSMAEPGWWTGETRPSAYTFRIRCPYGQAGDRLWVRETWYCDHCEAKAKPPDKTFEEEWRRELYYRADGDLVAQGFEAAEGSPWRPSIHMPRWASRLLLEVTEVRCERLQDITEADARAEGMDFERAEQEVIPDRIDARLAFLLLWDRINGKRPGCGWADNPWVWVIKFKRAAA